MATTNTTGGSVAATLATDPATIDLNQDEYLRYSRHLILPEVGLEGQKKLKAASVLCIGTGGLGSPLTMYLAAAGVGRIGLVDFDVVDTSNLQRQIVHGTKDVGKPKIESAKETLLDINPHTVVETHDTLLSSENVWLHLPLRGAGYRFLGGEGSLLSLPVSRAAPPGPGPLVRGRRRPGRSAGYRRLYPGQ
jgi:hypothetical protein